MTYKEREIARLEGVKDGLIKKLVEECEAINDEIIALRNGTPRKKDSETYYERGYAKGRADAIDELEKIFKDFFTKQNNPNSKFRPPIVLMKKDAMYILEQLKDVEKMLKGEE